MEIFDTYYRPDTPSQRYRLLAVSVPGLLLGLLPWVKPLTRLLAKKAWARFAADTLATVLHILERKGPYPSPLWLIQVGLIALALLTLLWGIKLQIQVLQGFAPGSRMLRLAQKLLVAEGLLLLGLIFTWPS